MRWFVSTPPQLTVGVRLESRVFLFYLLWWCPLVLLILVSSYEINHCLILPLDPGAQEALDPLTTRVCSGPSSGPELHTSLYILGY